MLEEDARDLELPAEGGRGLQRPHANLRMAGERVGVGAALEQRSRRLGLSGERGEVERREAVLRPGVGLGEPLEVADEGGVEAVERRIRVEHGSNELVVPAVEGAAECGEALGVPGGRRGRVARDQRAHRLGVTCLDQREDVPAHRAGAYYPPAPDAIQ